MDKHAVALVLEEIATLLDADTGNRFRARAFRTAARAVQKLDVDLPAAVRTGALREVGGIGPATAAVIEELVVTGESSYHATLRERAPSGMRELSRVPGLGPGRIARLHRDLGIHDLDDLEAAAQAGRIATLRGFGPATQARILGGIGFARSASGRRRYHQAEEAGSRIAGFIASLDGVVRAEAAGPLRRRCEIVDTLVIAVAVAGDADRFADAVQRTPGVTWTDASQAGIRGRLGDGLVVEVVVARPAHYGAALIFATGSTAHVAGLRQVAAARGLELDATGLRAGERTHDTPDEESVYEVLGLQFVPPELREAGAEIDAARAGTLPRLIEHEDLQGSFHCHTTYSDGKATIEAMAEGAIALGWRYLGIADHSMNAGYAGGLTPVQLRRQRREINAWNRRRGGELRLFAGVEADILQDGALDYAAVEDAAVLAELDYVIGSVHSFFRAGRAAMTRRMRRAVADPHLTILGHATGRLVLTREGYDVDLESVIDAAADAGAVIEINADPHRLDMSWQHWPHARSRGVLCAINPDAHSVGGMSNVRYGVNIARKAWLRQEDVLNAWELEAVESFLQERKDRVARRE
jgi:DNA polymerase (family X)